MSHRDAEARSTAAEAANSQKPKTNRGDVWTHCSRCGGGMVHGEPSWLIHGKWVCCRCYQYTPENESTSQRINDATENDE